MQYPYISVFPDQIDKRTFFHDIDLKNKSIMEAYNLLISQGKYTDANILINQQNDIHTYSADLFNYLEIKIYNFQNVVLKKEKYNPFCFSANEPEGETDIWIDG